MSVDRSDNAPYGETVQDRGWRQMSARLDREMPVRPGGLPRELLILLVVFLFIALMGVTYWFSSGTNTSVRPIARLDNVPIRTIQNSDVTPYPISLKKFLHKQFENSGTGRSGAGDQMTPGLDHETGQESDNGEREKLDFTFSEDMVVGHPKTLRSDQSSGVSVEETAQEETVPSQQIRRTPIPPIEFLSLDLLKLQAINLTQRNEKMKVPLHKSMWVRMSGRLDKRFSQSGLKIGLGKQWKKNQWTLQTGLQFSMLDYFSHSRERSPGSRIDQHLTMREFAFLEGDYSSYNDVLKLAGKTYYGGISARLGRGIYSGLYAFAGTGIHHIIGGKNQSINLSAEGFGGSESKSEDVNALNLVDQGVVSPWMWTMSAGLKWHLRPDLAFTIQYEQPVNRVMEKNTIALDEYPDLYWMELGISLRLKSD